MTFPNNILGIYLTVVLKAQWSMVTILGQYDASVPCLVKSLFLMLVSAWSVHDWVVAAAGHTFRLSGATTAIGSELASIFTMPKRLDNPGNQWL